MSTQPLGIRVVCDSKRSASTTADDVRAVAYIVEDIEALGVHVASASWVGYTDHPLTVQVSGDEAAVDTVAAALDLDPDDGTSANYVRMSGRVLVYSGRSVPPCTCRATCHHKAVTA